MFEYCAPAGSFGYPSVKEEMAKIRWNSLDWPVLAHRLLAPRISSQASSEGKETKIPKAVHRTVEGQEPHDEMGRAHNNPDEPVLGSRPQIGRAHTMSASSGSVTRLRTLCVFRDCASPPTALLLKAAYAQIHQRGPLAGCQTLDYALITVVFNIIFD